ncbi:MAG: hypothetical protein WKG01_30460, partial [Kofleriaceae bacterium]
MSKEPGPHVVVRSSIGNPSEPARSDEAWPTSKVDSSELRGLVGRTTGSGRAKRPTDLDVSFEVVTTDQLSPEQPRARGGRVVQTVRRSSIRRAPEPVHAAGSAPLPVAPVAALDPDDPFADMFDAPPAAVVAVAVVVEAPEPVQHFDLEPDEPDEPPVPWRAASPAAAEAPIAAEPALGELDDLAIALAPAEPAPSSVPFAAPIAAPIAAP